MRSTTGTDPYLSWDAAQHADGCTAEQWDVRILERQGPHPQDPGDRTTVQVAMRAVCRVCHAHYELAADTGWVDETTGGLDGPCIDRTTAPVHGHQVRPLRIREYWLHAYGGSHQASGHPFSHYYLTRSRRAPTSAEEIVGAVGTTINRLGNTKWIGATVRPSRVVGVAPVRRAEKLFGTPKGAAYWIVSALADEPDTPATPAAESP